MTTYLENNNYKLIANSDTGMIEGLYNKNDLDGGNFLISTEALEYDGFNEQKYRLLGSTLFELKGDDMGEYEETGKLPIYQQKIDNDQITFIKKASGLEFSYQYNLLDDGLKWTASVKNVSKNDITFTKLAHWIPIAYIYGTRVEKNLTDSWSMVPSLDVSTPFMVCKKRNGKGPDYIVRNISGGMKSVGSACSYENLFFKQTSPSLSGIVLYNAALCWNPLEGDNQLTDWQYKDLYKEITLIPGQELREDFEIRSFEVGMLKDKLLSLGTNFIDFPPYTLVGEKAKLRIYGGKPIKYTSYYVPSTRDKVDIEAEVKEFDIEKKETNNNIVTKLNIGPFMEAGERKLVIEFEDGQIYSLVFPVYSSLKDYIEAISNYIYTYSFISDTEDPNYSGYRSVSPQGESCAKGSFLLIKNSLSSKPNRDEIKQVELNTTNHILPNWFDENLNPKRKYGSGSDKFVRMYDIEYIILQFYLLGTFSDDLLSLNKSSYYIQMAAKLLRYRIEKTPDKNERELEETGLAMTCHWDMDDLIKRYSDLGFKEEAEEIKHLLDIYIDKQKDIVYSGKSMITEICFDNAGVAMSTQTLLSLHENEAGLEAAKLLKPNVAYSNDYRCFAPDRWWEAQAPMYHNLWAANVAKAMIQAYEAGGDEDYLILSYRSMMPLFYNYDWTIRSARRTLKAGEGVSTYCITAPNLNHEPCSHNRFGQQIFEHDDFINSLNLQGDDWDNGVDLVIYLQSFGQKCYVEGTKDKPYAVGGQVESIMNGYLIHSYSAYPSSYHLKPWNMTIKRSSNSYTIDKIELIKGELTKVYIKGKLTDNNKYLWIDKNGHKEKVYPEFIKL